MAGKKTERLDDQRPGRLRETKTYGDGSKRITVTDPGPLWRKTVSTETVKPPKK